MRIVGLLARGPARFDIALARLSSLAQEHGLDRLLRSEAIPERLRGAAERIASLLTSNPASAEVRAEAPVVSLEQVLAARAVPSHGVDVLLEQGPARLDTAGVGVCPFTGLRADGTPPMAAGASEPTLELPLPKHADPLPSTATPRAKAQEPAREVPARKPRARASERAPAEARDPAREQNAEARGPARGQNAEARSPAREQPAEAAAREPKRRQKDKERLAGTRAVEKTSARSATRSAAKQPRSRVQRSPKKA
jgi:uncharacterized protein (UPF0147 family)